MGENVAIIVAKKRGGLFAVAEEKNFTIIPESITKFASLTTHSDEEIGDIGLVDTINNGYIAHAVKKVEDSD